MRVVIERLAERRLWAFIRATKNEIGGLGYARLQEPDGLIHWTQTFLTPQEVSSSEVDFESTNGDELAIERAAEDGMLADPEFVWVSWHSHHTMKPYWSETDCKRIKAIGAVGVTRLLSLVGCHDGSYEMRLDVFDVQAQGVDIGQVTISDLALTHSIDDFDESIAAELNKNVKEKKYPVGFTTGSSYTTGTHKPTTTTKRETKKEKKEREKVERQVIAELVAEGFERNDASDLLATMGIEHCEDLLDNRLKADIRGLCS